MKEISEVVNGVRSFSWQYRGLTSAESWKSLRALNFSVTRCKEDCKSSEVQEDGMQYEKWKSFLVLRLRSLENA